MEPNKLPPLWALDMAAKAASFKDWSNVCECWTSDGPVSQSVIAHARTLVKYEPAPADPAELKRWQDAREAAAAHAESIAFPKGAREARSGLCDSNDNVHSAYIALCRRDGVEPQDKAPGA